MDTSAIRDGDLVRVDDGLAWWGRVASHVPADAGGGLMCSPLCARTDAAARPRRVKPRDVVGHWRKTKATVRREQTLVGAGA